MASPTTAPCSFFPPDYEHASSSGTPAHSCSHASSSGTPASSTNKVKKHVDVDVAVQHDVAAQADEVQHDVAVQIDDAQHDVAGQLGVAAPDEQGTYQDVEDLVVQTDLLVQPENAVLQYLDDALEGIHHEAPYLDFLDEHW